MSGYKQRGMGGDLHGVEWLLMLYVVPPVVVVTSSLVSLVGCLSIPRPRAGHDRH